jgi:hypothetical protein
MTIFKKAIPRRTFLKGAGTMLGLPVLNSMVPAFASSPYAPGEAPPVRLGVVYVPNGIIMEKWTPAAEGAAFELPPIMEPIASFQDQVTVLSGLNHLEANPAPGEGAGDHPRASSVFLTGVHAKTTEGTDMEVGVSADQIAARELGKHTQLASLELGVDSPDIVGSCEAGYTCAYFNTISWRTATTPNPMENKPRAVFERLFGDTSSTDPAARLTRIRENRSILDSVIETVRRLQKGLGPDDNAKLSEYLAAIRDVERRIQMAEEQGARELPSLERPVGIPPTFQEHAKLMFDLQTLAYQTDLTRVTTFMMGRELTGRTYREIGIPDAHHGLTHHSGDAGMIEKVIQINTYHMKMFSYFLDKLRSTPDGDGSLLDHSMIIYGGGISNGNMHKHDNLPILLAGGGSGRLQGGRHLRYPLEKQIPMTNLYLTLLDKVGIPVEKLGDSTGKLELEPLSV